MTVSRQKGPVSKKVVIKRTSAKKKAVSKKSQAKKGAVKKSPAKKKAAIKKAPAKKMAAKKAPTKKKVDHIESLAGFLELLDKLKLQEETLFRGQRQDFPLIPKIARGNLRLKAPILDAEREMFESFKRQARRHVENGNTIPDWDWLAIAQHHGLPTRLLDWTKNPLASLWFAVNAEPNDSDPGILWIYQPAEDDYIKDPDSLKPFDMQRTQIHTPNHAAQRISAQTGLFTAHAYFNKFGFVPFEESTTRSGDLRKYEIPAEAFSDLRFDLDRCGVNSASIYPDLDGLTSHLQWLHGQLADEV